MASGENEEQRNLGKDTGVAPAANTIRKVLELFSKSGTIYAQFNFQGGVGGGILGNGTASVTLGMMHYRSTTAHGDKTMGDWFFSMFLHEVTHTAAGSGPPNKYNDTAFYNVFARSNIYAMTPDEYLRKNPQENNLFTRNIYSAFAGFATDFSCTGYKGTIIK